MLLCFPFFICIFRFHICTFLLGIHKFDLICFVPCTAYIFLMLRGLYSLYLLVIEAYILYFLCNSVTFLSCLQSFDLHPVFHITKVYIKVSFLFKFYQGCIFLSNLFSNLSSAIKSSTLSISALWLYFRALEMFVNNAFIL